MAQQCRGITKSGQQCKMTGSFENGYCFRHKEQADVEALIETAVITPRKSVTAEPVFDIPEPQQNTTPEAIPAAPVKPATTPPQKPKPLLDNPAADTSPHNNGTMVPIIIAAVLFIIAAVLLSRRKPVRYIWL